MPEKALTVQKHQDVEPQIGGLTLPIIFSVGEDIAPEWDTVDRDAFLRTFWKRFGNDMLQAVLATVIAKVQTQNWELEGPKSLTEMYHRIIRDEADFRRGYDTLIARGLLDYYSQDNGWFMERFRAGTKDYDGPCLGFAHLDSARMRPTGNADFPYTYEDVFGEYHLMHYSQFIRIVDMPGAQTNLYDDQRGFCALSRTLSTAMILTMVTAMKRERLADLPPSALAIFNNINRKQFETALALKGAEDDMKNNLIYRQLLPLFGIDPAHPASVQFLSLREVWEGYDDQTQYDISAYSFAAGFRTDPREFWPVSQGPLGTGKEAEVQHQKAKGKGHGLIFTGVERAFNSDLSLPKAIHFKYAMQDIEEEQQKAAIHQVQIGNIKAMQEAGAGLSAEEVRYLLVSQYKVLPKVLLKPPAEGEDTDHTLSDVYLDDVERQVKEFAGWYFGPVVTIDDYGSVKRVNGSKKQLPDGPLFIGDIEPPSVVFAGLKGGPGSGNYGHAGRPGLVGGSGGRGASAISASFSIGDRVKAKKSASATFTVIGETEDGKLRCQYEYGDGKKGVIRYDPAELMVVEKGVGEAVGELHPPVKVYHGTGEDVMQAIRSQGLRKFKADEVDREIELMELGKPRPASVYMTTDRDMAKRYAEGYKGGFAGSVIVELDIPANEFKKFAMRDELGSATDYRMERNIPPEWITSMEVVQ